MEMFLNLFLPQFPIIFPHVCIALHESCGAPGESLENGQKLVKFSTLFSKPSRQVCTFRYDDTAARIGLSLEHP